MSTLEQPIIKALDERAQEFMPEDGEGGMGAVE